MINAILGAGIVAGVSAVSAVVSSVSSDSLVSDFQSHTRETITRELTLQQLQQFAALRPRDGDRGEWRPLPTNTAGLREIPILHQVNTALPALTTRENFSAVMALFRRALSALGYGSFDVRCYLYLPVHECGFSWSGCFNHALSNIKAHRPFYSTEQDILQHQRGWTRESHTSGVHILQGRYETRPEVYFSYPDFPAAMRHELSFLDNYTALVSGYTRGGLDGLVQGQRALGNTTGSNGWSQATPDQREQRARDFWERCAGIAGDLWAR